MVCFKVSFLGSTVVDRRFSSPMVPWVVADIKRRKKVIQVTLVIEDNEIKGIDDNDTVLFRHHIQNLVRFCCEPNNIRTFLYLVRLDSDPLLHCYLHSALEVEDVMEILQAMKTSSRECSNGQALVRSQNSFTSLCPDISPSHSQFFEVLYVGKIKVVHQNVPDTFVDDALEKIKLLKKVKKIEEKDVCFPKLHDTDGDMENEGNRVKRVTETNEMVLVTNCENKRNMCDNIKKLKSSFSQNDINVKIGLKTSLDSIKSAAISDMTKNLNNTDRNSLIDHLCPERTLISDDDIKRVNHEMGFRRARSGSVGVIETFKKKVSESNSNRTMLFYVGKSDVRLISPDKKQALFHKSLKDIVDCVKGILHNEHFGLICREDECYVGYLFKCECANVADDMVLVINQSFHSTKEIREPKQQLLSCEHCPMVWLHKLCTEIEGLSDRKTQHIIHRKIETLPSEEQETINTKFLGTESSNIKEQNEILMILLRTHCEAKQTRHVHDTAENRSEFLNNYLGGNTMFMRAKRSLTSSFDQLLKRRGSQLDNLSQSKELLNRISVNETDGGDNLRSTGKENGKTDTRIDCSSHENELLKNNYDRESSGDGEKNHGKKQSFQDIAAIAVNNRKIEKALFQPSVADEDSGEIVSSKTPIRDIFLKAGTTMKSPMNDNFPGSPGTVGSWRQTIFNKIVTPGVVEKSDENIVRKRTNKELRGLWKKAINQQLLLIRMEKENARLKARQEEATVKRMKLDYDELGNLNKDNNGIWDLISSKDSRILTSKCESQMLLDAVRQGVPPARRGDVWYFLAVQFCLKEPPYDTSNFPNFDVPYEELLKQLTSFQHAILIDLGRTFPNHPYYSSPLGPGQLALFNLLKAYSLIDPQVGYCQGLSFIAGVLLLHMSEEAAFLLLKHLMFRREIRKQYLPDMAALQVQLYQLTRLLYDTLPSLYEHFDKNEVAPTLYAAPWMLTLFASQFPLGFVTRVFDLLFLEHKTDIIFKVILALLEEHMEPLLNSSTFEEIMDYLKHEISKMSVAQVDKVLKRVLTLDISKRRLEYEVEYHILQEEISAPGPKLELKHLELENKRLVDQNLALLEQLKILKESSNLLEKSNSTQQGVINKLESQIQNLETTLATLVDFIFRTCEEHKNIVVPGDIGGIISNRNLVKLSNKSEKNLLKKSHSSLGLMENDKFKPESDLQNCSAVPLKTIKKDNLEEKDWSKQHSLRGMPLTVVLDDDNETVNNENPPNLRSKISFGVSSFFNSNQIKTDLIRKKNILSDSKSSQAGEFLISKNEGNNFSSSIDTIHVKESMINCQEEESNDLITHALTDTLKSTKSMNSMPYHPLNYCSEVNVTYIDTTRLK